MFVALQAATGLPFMAPIRDTLGAGVSLILRENSPSLRLAFVAYSSKSEAFPSDRVGGRGEAQLATNGRTILVPKKGWERGPVLVLWRNRIFKHV